MPDTCARCGQTHPRCAAHNKAGKPCGVQPRSGQKVCRLHGGSSPQALAEANRRQVEQAAEVELRKRWKIYGDQPVTDPLTELARVAGEVVAFKDYLRDQVTALDGVLTYWQEKEYLDGDGDVEWTKAAEEVRAIVAAYERAQDRAAKILAAIVKLDIADRMLSLRTRQADAIVDAVRTGLATIDLPTEIRQGAEAAVADALEQITLHDPTPKELTP